MKQDFTEKSPFQVKTGKGETESFGQIVMIISAYFYVNWRVQLVCFLRIQTFDKNLK